MGSTKLIYQVSTALIVVIFALAGLVKVVPGISPEMHDEMEDKFQKYVRVPPINALRLKPEFYMLCVGITEIACVALLLFGRSRPAVLATWVLLVIMVGAVYTHVAISDKLNDMLPAFICLGLVLARLWAMGALDDVQVKVKI